ncbi:lytic murein transglycosylase [Thalassobius sp. Cn5-15]|uniref:lytic murein transglycosylase n=1 Tax=Thalassobius sp. Cn5-15 TaxID=2917763 RepID=UPI001EF32483|nr:lytic murein transglycosylase [Thalassobius sp. Cn5-15]
MFRTALASLMIVTQLASPAVAQSTKEVRQFQQWVQQDLWPEARRAGVSRRVFDAALNGKVLLAPTKPNAQAEFGRPARYFGANTLNYTSREGQALLKKHSALLTRLEKETGVPGQILLSIWGRESGFGRVKIPQDAFQVLASKAFRGERVVDFRAELIAALTLVEQGRAPKALKSSWAGALGQPQFMPTNVAKFGRDGDSDGRVDIWWSEADTLASIAHYLAKHGWQRGRDWGFEVSVPVDVSCALEGPDQGRRISEWSKMGVTRVNGRAFPAKEARGEGYLMMPAGRHGPAFLVTPNFYALKEYNESDLYALFVGHVGDRIRYRMGDFSAGWAKTDTLLRADVAAMQRGLERLGHDVGGADGLAGFRTRRSIGRWQEATGQKATCWPSKAIVQRLK